MGATNYITVSKGKDAKEAFESARSQAQWAHGNNGYTGTIAEKDSFVQFQRPAGTRQATIKHIVEGIAGPDEEIAKLAKKYPKFPIRKMLQVCMKTRDFPGAMLRAQRSTVTPKGGSGGRGEAPPR